MNITLNIVSIHQTDANFSAYTRPYEVNSQIQQAISADLTCQKLPEPNFFRVILGASVQASTQADPDELIFNVEARHEAIVVLSPAEEMAQDDINSIIVNQVASILLGYTRAKIQDLTHSTGFPTVTLPILPPERLYTLLDVLDPIEPASTIDTK